MISWHRIWIHGLQRKFTKFTFLNRLLVLRFRLRSWLLYRAWEFPCCIGIELVSACNRSCSYCSNADAHQAARKMTEETFTIIAKRLQEMSWFGDVSFNYVNEPLIDKRLPQFVKELVKFVPTCRPIIYSNGDFLTESKATELFEAGLQDIIVTRHPPFSNEWDAKMNRLKSQFPKITVRSIEGASWLMTWGGRIKLKNLKPYKACPVITESIHVLADGRVPMCISDTKQSEVVGNIHTEGFLNIWHGEKFQALLKQAKSGKPTNETCIACYAARIEQPA